MRKLLLALGFAAAALTAGSTDAFAGKRDLRVGMYEGTWCGYPVTYDIRRKEDDRWVFHGRLIFHTYNDMTDKLWIEQYGDQSLRMIRYLSAENEGKTQVVQTYTPVMHLVGSTEYPTFKVQEANGPDCPGKKTVLDLGK